MAGAASIKDYIGSKVSLISASDVRYEGCLYTIDPEESTVALQRVRCMGTEYRRTGDQAIPPSDTTYEFIIFRGEHIKSLHVAEDQRSPTRNENPDMLNLLKFSPNKGDKRSGHRSNGVQDAYPPDDRSSPPKRFVGIAPQRQPPRQYDDYSRGPVYDNRRPRRNSPPQYQQHYNQPPQDHGYQRYPPPGYGPPMDRGYQQGGYQRYGNRGGGRRPEQQWGYYPQQQQQQNYGGNWGGGRRQRRQRNQRRDNSYRDDYRDSYRGNYRDRYQDSYRGNQRGYQGGQDHRQKDKRDVVPGQGGFLQKVGQTKGDIQIPDSDFDISQANEGFDKTKLKEEYAKRVEESKTGEPSSAIDEKHEAPEESTSAGQTEESPKRKYEMPEAAYKAGSKGGFFDSLSTDRDQKVDKEALKQQRRVDEDTFGEIAKNYMSRHNRRRGGGGGGGARRWGGAQRGRQRPRRSRNWFPRK